MNNNYSPLRYPGGKAVMSPFLKDFIKANNIHNVVYVEPYAGGAGAALNLLFTRQVDKIIINDASIPIYSFWNSLINHSEQVSLRLILGFCLAWCPFERIERVSVILHHLFLRH